MIDGDTIRMVLDHGMRITSEQDIRLLGVDAPEVRGPEKEAGQKAKAFVVGWVGANSADGEEWPFIVTTEKDKQSFARYVGSVVTQSGESLTDALLEVGLGEPHAD